MSCLQDPMLVKPISSTAPPKRYYVNREEVPRNHPRQEQEQSSIRVSPAWPREEST